MLLLALIFYLMRYDETKEDDIMGWARRQLLNPLFMSHDAVDSLLTTLQIIANPRSIIIQHESRGNFVGFPLRSTDGIPYPHQIQCSVVDKLSDLDRSSFSENSG